MNILWLWDRLDCLGGVETLLLGMAKQIKQTGHTVRLGVFKNGYVAEMFEEAGVQVIEIKRKRLLDFACIAKLAKMINTLDIDVIHTHGHFPGIAGRIAGKLTGTKVISTYHLGLHEDGHPKSTKLLTKLTLPLADYATFVSRGVEQSYFGDSSVFQEEDIGRKKHFTIYNGIDVAALRKQVEGVDVASVRKELAIGEDDIFLLNVGRFTEQKGQCDLIMAMKEIIRSHPNAKLLIFGEGELEDDLQKQIAANSLQPNIRLLPPTKEIHKIMKACDVFVLPSLYEGLPMALIEVMAIGKPVVATDVTGINEVICHEVNGLLVQRQNIYDLAENLLSLINDRDLQCDFTDNAAETIKNDFCKSKMMLKYLNLYEK